MTLIFHLLSENTLQKLEVLYRVHRESLIICHSAIFLLAFGKTGSGMPQLSGEVAAPLSSEEGSCRAGSQTSDASLRCRHQCGWRCECWRNRKWGSLAAMGRNCLCRGRMCCWADVPRTLRQGGIPGEAYREHTERSMSPFLSPLPSLRLPPCGEELPLQCEALLTWCLQEPQQLEAQQKPAENRKEQASSSSSNLAGSSGSPRCQSLMGNRLYTTKVVRRAPSQRGESRFGAERQ